MRADRVLRRPVGFRDDTLRDREEVVGCEGGEGRGITSRRAVGTQPYVGTVHMNISN